MLSAAYHLLFSLANAHRQIVASAQGEIGRKLFQRPAQPDPRPGIGAC